jgi:hypothetical protein
MLAQEASLCLFDARTGLSLGSIAGVSGADLTAIVTDPRNHCAVVGASDGSVTVWELGSNNGAVEGVAADGLMRPCVCALELRQPVAYLIAHPLPGALNKRRFGVAAATADGAVHTFEVSATAPGSGCRRTSAFEAPPSLAMLDFAPRQALYAAAGSAGDLQLWEAGGEGRSHRLAAAMRLPKPLVAGCVADSCEALVTTDPEGNTHVFTMPKLQWLLCLRRASPAAESLTVVPRWEA